MCSSSMVALLRSSSSLPTTRDKRKTLKEMGVLCKKEDPPPYIAGTTPGEMQLGAKKDASTNMI